MEHIKVISPGSLTTIQDKGRYGFQQFGIPVAGAMDEYALRLANLLVANKENEGALEITLLGPSLEFQSRTIIAITGADLGARLNKSEIPLWEAILVEPGDVLDFTGVKKGCRAYLAVAGGFDIPVFMNSKSTYVRGKLGGFKGRSLKAGDILPIHSLKAEDLSLVGVRVEETCCFQGQKEIVLRVVLGPQDESFTKEGIDTFLDCNYKITNEADRMGYRLDGDVIEHKKGADIISDGIAMGSIQVPGHGSPIIMMADRQTAGGYTKIATVITPDLRRLAQAKPGDSLSFEEISIEDAHTEYIKYEKKIEKIRRNLEEKKRKSLNSKKYKMIINQKEYLIEIEEIKN